MNARQRARRGELAYAESIAPAGEEPALLVTVEELQAAEWQAYDAAMTEAVAHRDRGLDAALERLLKVMQGAYLEYAQAVDRANATYDAARRAAMHAHELSEAS